MGTVPHHQAKAADFLRRADRAITERDPTEAASALRRAASHAATALAVHCGCKHSSRRRLEFPLHVAVADRRLSRSHLKTFRQTHSSFPRKSGPVPDTRPESRGVEGITLRRLRRRVAAMLTAVAAFLNGQPKPVRYHKLYLREPNRPVLPDLAAISQILNLPNYAEIRRRFNLTGAPLAAEPDPHGWYDHGQPPRPCSCHRDLWDQHEAGDENHITLSPLWRRALEKTFRTRLPDQLQLTC
ncbi:MAG: hypothetical protein F4W95_01350 [Chloroflexi bacterium]|nr:hypothetical protein [Chloroflexota bacterium]MYD47112.1 hypothetical protein [Chloroflexota bacterium]